jgi:hypothetical protein
MSVPQQSRFNGIYSLFYPAILGTGLIGLSGRLIHLKGIWSGEQLWVRLGLSDVPAGLSTAASQAITLFRLHLASFVFGLALAVIYVGSYVRSLRIPKAPDATQKLSGYEGYTAWMFRWDRVECALMLWAFGLIAPIGLFSPSAPDDATALIRDLAGAHGVLAASLVVSLFWRVASKQKKPWREQWISGWDKDAGFSKNWHLTIIRVLAVGGSAFVCWTFLGESNPDWRLYLCPWALLVLAVTYFYLREEL